MLYCVFFFYFSIILGSIKIEIWTLNNASCGDYTQVDFIGCKKSKEEMRIVQQAKRHGRGAKINHSIAQIDGFVTHLAPSLIKEQF